MGAPLRLSTSFDPQIDVAGVCDHQTEPFVFYSNFTASQLETGMQFVLEDLAEAQFEERFVYKKYASKKFLKASIFARNFAVKYLPAEAEA